jgi:hypothetical protein
MPGSKPKHDIEHAATDTSTDDLIESMANFAERGTVEAVVTYENGMPLRDKEKDRLP